ncbi:FAD-binding oxidoreductase [Clostridium sp. SHJSY1]|uniref:FAD-dependent oxidoreductase n=1 Tax=Clostridium sp. SHJSY1 TaxID=2942483 RepID=UPI002874F9AC|nr:FAD-binding oxidoreductase [Clostridium sp. SHJSY1]MDS0525119.1 FAD-binding oxidoreductase [Clostridium sp. SHJSY1]
MKYVDYKELTGVVITQDNFSYEEDRKSWNRAIDKYPLAIVYCKNNEQVGNAIIWARQNLLEIRIRSGRHHYEGYSTGDDVVVIDVSKMNKISVDEEKNIVKIQGGVRNRELYDTLNNLGYPFPGGGCPTVGVPGLVLGGGWGYSSRLFGLACDSLIEAEIVDFKGNIIITSEKVNNDLFWALKGAGGGNFGIVTSMTFRLPKKIEMATLIDIDCLEARDEEIIKAYEVWENLFKDLDRRINLKMGIYNSLKKGPGVRITGVFYGTKEEAKSILVSFKTITKKEIFKLEYLTVLEVNRIIQDSHPPYEKYKSSGRFVYNDYTRYEIEKIIELVKERAEGAVYTAVSFYGLGGAVNDKDKKESAFYYRDAKFIMGFQSVWEESKYAQENIEWVKKKQRHINEITTGSYVSFPCAELEDYEREYYGENYYRLREIKRKYDSENVFNFPQSINNVELKIAMKKNIKQID